LARQSITRYAQLTAFVEDRPGHDRRYAIDATKIRQAFGWIPKHSFEVGLAKMVRWYIDHRDWCEAMLRGRYGRQRLGLAQALDESSPEVPQTIVLIPDTVMGGNV
jgi:dTDP-glucose 4,6-dehydratase